MSFLQEHYARKVQLDEKTAWIGRAFAGLRRRQLSYGGGDFLSIVDVLVDRLRASEDADLREMAEWVQHCEQQQRGMYSRISEFTGLLGQPAQLQTVDRHGLDALLKNARAVTPEADRILYAPPRTCELQLDPELFSAMIAELLLNAVKFSPEDTGVDLFTTQSAGQLVISILNCCPENSPVFAALKVRGRNALGEPFIGGFDHPRIRRPGHDLCIGLCFVASLAHRLGGRLVLSDAFDFSQERPRPRFSAALHLPLVSRSNQDSRAKFQVERLVPIARNPD